MQQAIVSHPESLQWNPKERVLLLLKDIQTIVGNTKPVNGIAIDELSKNLIDTLSGLVADIIQSIEWSERLWQINIEKLVELLGILALFPWFKRFLLPLYDNITLAIRDEIAQNQPGDWMDNLSSLESWYSILRELVLTWWKIPDLYGGTRALIDDPTIYGIEITDNPTYHWLFESSRGDSKVSRLLARVWTAVGTMGNHIIGTLKQVSTEEKLQPSREDILKRRLESLFNIGIWALSIWDEQAFRRDMDLYFEYVRRFANWNAEYFNFKVRENEELFLRYPFLFAYFKEKISKFSNPKEVADSLFEVARIHFSYHKNPLFVFDILEEVAWDLSYWTSSDLVRECLEMLILDPTTNGIQIQRGMKIMGLIHPETNWWALNLITIWKLCEQYQYSVSSQEAYALVESNIKKITHEDQRLEAKLSLYKAQWMKDREKEVLADIEGKIAKGPRDDLWDHFYTRILVLAWEEYGRNWDMAWVVLLRDKIMQTHSYPNDHVRDMILGAIEWMVKWEQYAHIETAIDLIPVNLRWSGINKVVYSFISTWKLERALVWATNRANHRDANVISDQPSDLIGRILEESIHRWDENMSQRCLETLLDYPINEWAIKRVKDAYLRSPYLFTNHYLVTFSRHCISNFQAWVKSSHLTEVVKFLQELRVDNTSWISEWVRFLTTSVLNA